MDADRGKPGSGVLVPIAILLGIGALAWMARPLSTRPRPPSLSLKALASAQADFRGNDRDGDGKPNFWREDVAGLYTLVPKGEREPIKLIDLSAAAADARPVADLSGITLRAPKGGYWVRAIRHAGEDPAKPDPDRFALCAYPEDLSEHRWMFIISEGYTIFKAPAVKGGVDVFPDEKTLKEQWAKLD